MLDLILAVICGLGYRLRGSAGDGGWVEKIFGFPTGTFLGRFFWCVPVALLMAHTPLDFLFYAFLAYIGVMFGYWGGQFDLSQPKNNNWKNYATLTVRGMFIAFPLAVATGAWWGVVAGALFVPCYKFSIPISGKIKLPMLHSFSEWGEFLLGFFIAYGLLI